MRVTNPFFPLMFARMRPLMAHTPTVQAPGENQPEALLDSKVAGNEF